MSLTAMCPHCDQDVDVKDDVEVGEVFACEHCETDLEVVALAPLTLNESDEEEK
jgi:lysine biosynthesis protein LysW